MLIDNILLIDNIFVMIGFGRQDCISICSSHHPYVLKWCVICEVFSKLSFLRFGP